MDAEDGSANVVRVEASGRRESKIVAAALMRSTDYEPIIEDAVAGFARNASDKRRKVYAHAHSLVIRHLLLMRPPESIFEVEKLAIDLAIKEVERRWRARDNLPERRIKPSGTATSSIAARLLRCLASPTGVAVALPVIAAMIFFGLRNGDKVTSVSSAGNLVERWFSIPDGEPGVTAGVTARDVLADRRSARAAP